MFELFGLAAGAIVLIPLLVVAGIVIAVLCGVGHLLGFVWELVWGVFGVGFGLLFVFGMLAFVGLSVFLAILF